MTQTTPNCDSKLTGILLLSFELGKNKWTLTFGTLGKEMRRKDLVAKDLNGLRCEIRKAREKFGLNPKAQVFSCYEAGRDGFWLDRALKAKGVTNFVVDSSSILVDRKKRRAKTDRLDGAALLKVLRRHMRGDSDDWRVVHVPSEQEEDSRRLHREMERLQKERIGHRNRIESLLALNGIEAKVDKEFGQRVSALRNWKREALGDDLQGELRREHERLVLVEKQFQELKRAQKARLKEAEAVGEQADESLKKVGRLRMLKGVANASWPLVMEFFGWRKFENGKQVGALAGLTGTPNDSGKTDREQGISKAGNKRVRRLMVELSWCWLRYQPRSKISQWFQRKFGPGAKRGRRVGIVAVARRLLVALWRYVEHGEVPEGATLKKA